MKRLAIFGVTLSLVILTACGGGSGSSAPTPPVVTGAQTTINAFDLTGSAVQNGNGEVPINAGINGGAFRAAWDVDSSDPYRVEMFVSEDNTLDTNIDTQIAGFNCGSLTAIYECDDVVDMACEFDNSNHISCGTITVFNPGTDLTTFLTTLPKSAFLIFKACNSLLANCKTSAVAIELQ